MSAHLPESLQKINMFYFVLNTSNVVHLREGKAIFVSAWISL